MGVIKSGFSARSDGAKKNAETWQSLIEDLTERIAEAAQGGDQRSRERHTGRGKLLPRDRVNGLLDPGSAFLELSPLAAYGLHGGEIHGASLITGIGRVGGVLSVIVCNDATIKGGTYYPPICEEAPARAGNSPSRTICLVSIWWIPAAQTCLIRPISFRTGSISGASSTTKRTCPLRAFRRSHV